MISKDPTAQTPEKSGTTTADGASNATNPGSSADTTSSNTDITECQMELDITGGTKWRECHRCNALWHPVGLGENWRPQMCVLHGKGKYAPRTAK